MLTLQPYHVTRYPPPGPKWVQFGDDILGGAVDDVRSALERKKQWKIEYHRNRLQHDGMMPLGHQFDTHRDPEEQATDAYDHPPPPPGPPPDHAPARERQRRPEEPEGGYETAEEGVAPQPSHSILTSLSNGANSTLANMGAGLVHGGVWAAGAAASALGRGVARGISHLATGSNPLEVEGGGGGEQAGSESEEPIRAYPKAKAKAHPGKSAPYAWPARPWVDPSSYNGTGAHAFYIGSDDEHAPAAAAAAAPAAAPPRPRGRPIAQRDVRLARETLASMPENDRDIYTRSRRRG